MNLSSLQKVTKRSQKRLGQGHGSGRAKTSGRGTKGQKARRNISLSFEGGALPLVKRMPFLRGKARNFSFNPIPVVINVEKLDVFGKNGIVDEKTLVEKNFATAKELKARGVKILGRGEVSVALTVKVPVSQVAKAKIEKAGGNIAQ